MIKRIISFGLLMMLSNLSYSSSAVAYAHTEQGLLYYWATNYPHTISAERSVTEHCKDAAEGNNHITKCELLVSIDGPKYIALFRTIDQKSLSAGYSQDRQEAINAGYRQCLETGECPNNAEEVIFDKGQLRNRRDPRNAHNDHQLFQFLVEKLMNIQNFYTMYTHFQLLGGDTGNIIQFPNGKAASFTFKRSSAQSLAKAIFNQHFHLIDEYLQIEFPWDEGGNMLQGLKVCNWNSKSYSRYQKRSIFNCSIP